MSQVMKVITSWPALAWVSAAGVSCNLPPEVVMKSAVTSTLFLAAHASTCFCMVSFAPGTQWSQKPIFNLPAAPAVRICTNGRAAAAAPSLTALRRDTFDGLDIHYSLYGSAALIWGQPYPGQSFRLPTTSRHVGHSTMMDRFRLGW